MTPCFDNLQGCCSPQSPHVVFLSDGSKRNCTRPQSATSTPFPKVGSLTPSPQTLDQWCRWFNFSVISPQKRSRCCRQSFVLPAPFEAAPSHIRKQPSMMVPLQLFIEQKKTKKLWIMEVWCNWKKFLINIPSSKKGLQASTGSWFMTLYWTLENIQYQ